ncbi:MAG: glycosyltransferase family 39 protein [Bacteroidales bacterium]
MIFSPKFKKIDKVAVVILIIATFLLLLSINKALNASFTHDESYTYNHYVKSSLKTSILFLSNPTANNHILNTLLMAISSLIFGKSELALRIPNLIAYVFFLLFIYKILKRSIPDKILVVLSFIIINFNPFLIDFFSLARGYGLSISLIIISLYYLLIFSETNRARNYSLSMLFAVLATYSNISSLYFLCGTVLIYNFIIIKNYNQTSINLFKYLIKNNKTTFIYLAILIILLGWPIYILAKHNQFYFGGENNFWNDTIMSLIYSTLYCKSYNGIGLWILKLITITLPLLFLLVIYKDKKNIRSKKLSLILLLLISTVFVINIQH